MIFFFLFLIIRPLHNLFPLFFPPQTKLDFGSPKPPRREVLEEEASVDFVFIPPETKERVLTEHQKEVKRTKRSDLSFCLLVHHNKIHLKYPCSQLCEANVFLGTGLTSRPCTTTSMPPWIPRFSLSTLRVKRTLCKF